MSLLFNSNLLLIILEFCLIIALPLVAYFLLYQRHKCAYWQARGVPGPKPTLIRGNLAPLFFGGQSNVLTMHDWAGQFGRLYGCMWGQTPVLVFSRPEMVQQLLVTKFWQFHARMIGPIAGDPDRLKWVHLFNARGMRWKRLRAIATPAFSVSNLKKIIPTIDDSVKKAIKILEDTVLPTGKTLNIHPHFVEMAFDIIARVAMGQPESRQFHPESEAKLAVAAIQRINNNLFDYYAWLFPWLGRNVLRPLAAWTRRWRNDPIENLLAKIHAAVQERKRLKESGELDRNIGDGRLEDFIDLFLEAEVDDLELEEEAQRRGTSSVVGGGEKMARIERKNCLEEVVMQCFLFVLAGFDTTSSSLSQICHRLAWNPQVQEKLQAEIDSVCGRDVDDWVPSYEQLAQLKYTEAVIKETLRLSPRVIARSCTQKTTLGDLQIEEGVGVQIDVLTLHRDQSVWGQDAELFVPERWEEPNSRSAMYLAFGIGPRICIGMRMALMQNKMALVRLMQRFSVRRCAQTERKIEFAGQVVLAPKSVCVMLEPR